MIKIYDGVVEDHVAQLISAKMKDVRWKFDYHSKKEHISKHWHVLCAENSALDKKYTIKNEFDWVMPIWNSAMLKYDFRKLLCKAVVV